MLVLIGMLGFPSFFLRRVNNSGQANTCISITAFVSGSFSPSSGKKWKKTCCVPSFVLFALTLACLVTGMALLAIFKVDSANVTVKAVLVAVASVVGLALLLNCRTWWQVADSVLRSQRRRLHSAANSMHKLKSEGFMKVYKISKHTGDASLHRERFLNTVYFSHHEIYIYIYNITLFLSFIKWVM